MRELLWVAAGGAIGSSLRYLAYHYTPLIVGRSAVFSATLFVNLVGCLLIGLLAEWLEARDVMDTALRLFLITGFLGGFTTYSAFGMESMELMRTSFPQLLAYTGLHLFLGIGAVWLGQWTGMRLFAVL